MLLLLLMLCAAIAIVVVVVVAAAAAVAAAAISYVPVATVAIFFANFADSVIADIGVFIVAIF